MKNSINLYLQSFSNKQELLFTPQAHLIKGPVITYCPRWDDFKMESLVLKNIDGEWAITESPRSGHH